MKQVGFKAIESNQAWLFKLGKSHDQLAERIRADLSDANPFIIMVAIYEDENGSQQYLDRD